MTGGGSTFVEGVVPSGGKGSNAVGGAGGRKPAQKTNFSNFNIKFWALHEFNLINLQQ